MSSNTDVGEVSVIVSGIPIHLDLKDVQLHFLDKKNGGCGDVKAVSWEQSRHANNSKTARVTFESESTLTSVLSHSHEMEGSKLQLSTDVKIFTVTTTLISKSLVSQINPTRFASLCPNGVKVEACGDHFKLTGDFDQIMLCRDRIAKLLGPAGSVGQNPSSTPTVPTAPVVTPSKSPSTPPPAPQSSPSDTASGQNNSATKPTANPIKSAAAAAIEAKNAELDGDCVICLTKMNPTDSVLLDKCPHRFHRKCIDESFRRVAPVCPVCKTPYGVAMGSQPPNGRMTVTKQPGKVPGFNCTSYLQINYEIPGGIQGPEHPSPGRSFSGTVRTAYLPDTPHGRVIAKLLQKAFDNRLIFTVGTSVTTGQSDVVVWNGIHHKTELRGGPFGYPDASYLDRVEKELADFGLDRKMVGG